MLKTYYILIVSILLALPTGSHAQSQVKFGMDEVYISEGLVTIEEANAWNGKGGLKGYVDMPSSISGALFLTYRHFFNDRFALGATAGIDNSSGIVSYGNPKINGTGNDGTSGAYHVKTYTGAVEGLVTYFRNKKKGRFTLYAYVGLGLTSYQDKYIINSGGLYGSHVSIPAGEHQYQVINFSAQVTPIGLRFGNKIAGFVEAGFGYKGLLSSGLSIRF